METSIFKFLNFSLSGVVLLLDLQSIGCLRTLTGHHMAKLLFPNILAVLCLTVLLQCLVTNKTALECLPRILKNF